jgi:hypothetical protein
MRVVKAKARVIRGCGASRKKGSTYLESGFGPGGKPLEHFLFDPPKPYTVDCKRGIQLIDINGVNHVVDYVGESGYPWASDILEEVRLYGLSRSVNPEVIKGKLSPSSKILLVHARAILKNAAALYSYLENNRLRFRCALYNTRTNLEHLKTPEIPCTRHSYALAPATNQKQLGQRALFIREFTPHTVYAVEPLWPGAPEPEFAMGIIAALPITNISVVAADDGSHLQTVEDLCHALPDFNVEASDY